MYGRYKTPGLFTTDIFDNLAAFCKQYIMKEATTTKQVLIDAMIERIVKSIKIHLSYKKGLKTIRKMDRILGGRI
jgi:hypothetical protein